MNTLYALSPSKSRLYQLWRFLYRLGKAINYGLTLMRPPVQTFDRAMSLKHTICIWNFINILTWVLFEVVPADRSSGGGCTSCGERNRGLHAHSRRPLPGNLCMHALYVFVLQSVWKILPDSKVEKIFWTEFYIMRNVQYLRGTPYIWKNTPVTSHGYRWLTSGKLIVTT